MFSHLPDDIELTVNPEGLALAEQKELLHQLCAIVDLQFDTLKPRLQLKLMKRLQIMDVNAGDVLIQEGDAKEDGSFYFILGPKDAQVEVVRQIDGEHRYIYIYQSIDHCIYHCIFCSSQQRYHQQRREVPELFNTSYRYTTTGKEEFLTRINAGQYFGEKYFISNRHVSVICQSISQSVFSVSSVSQPIT